MVNSIYVYLERGTGHFACIHRQDKRYHVYKKITPSTYNRLESMARERSKISWLIGRVGGMGWAHANIIIHRDK